MDFELRETFSLFGDKSVVLEKFTDKELKFDVTPSDLRYSMPNINGREVLF